MQKKLFLSKVIQMAASMIVFNVSSICYGVFISARSGENGIGLFHLIMSVHSLGMSLSVSGMSLTATRLLSDMPQDKGFMCSDDIMKKCLKICISTSAVAAGVMFFGADIISQKILDEPQCAFCLRILAPSLVCIGISSVVAGYFTAFAKVGSACVGKLFGEAAGWGITLVLFKNFDKEKMYVAVIIANALSSLTECVANIVLWQLGRIGQRRMSCNCTYRHIISIASPLALGSYLKTGLVSCENLLIPICLNYGQIGNALGQYGALKGMSIQLLTFPYVFIGAFTSLIVPEIARRHSVGHKNSIKYISELSVDSILKFAFFIWCVFLIWGNELCSMFFTAKNAGDYLKMLSLLPVFMYLDSVTDAILKGLDKQVFTLKVNIADSCMRVILIFLLVPIYGIKGYIYIMYISEIINLSISYIKLKKITNIRFSPLQSIVIPTSACMGSLCILKVISVDNTITQILVFAGVYLTFLSLTKAIFGNKTKIRDIFSNFAYNIKV